jgi:Tfp pilus assembly protein PilX
MKQHTRQFKQQGVVSLFVVIFAALLMTVVTVGFVQLMIKDQRQATSSDLSQSAYDSAQAGVEDAKRLLLLDQACRNNTASPSVNCLAITNALTPIAGGSETTCDTLSRAGIVNGTTDETIIQQSDGDTASKLNQAYTCVKVVVNTDDYKGQIDVNQSDIVPITGASDFDRVEVSWFSREDVSTASSNPTVDLPVSGTDISLPAVGSTWAQNRPTLLRAQLMQLGGGFKLSEFDREVDGKSNANTLFLYPSRIGVTDKAFAIDGRQSNVNAPQLIRCNLDFSSSEYACKAILQLPVPVDGNVAQRNAYLRLTGLYNGAHYSLRLMNGATYVKFNGVQPQVDSTGRANDMFRRVKARIELTGDFTYPEAAIDMQGNLCKNFTITDADSGYVPSATCTP